MSISTLSPSVVQDLVPDWIHITNFRPLPPIPTPVPERLNMHPYIHSRSARSGSQSSDDTLVNNDFPRTLEKDGRQHSYDLDRHPWIRISNLPLSFTKYSFDESLLAVMDDQLLDRPFDSFADDCYAHAIAEPDLPPAYHSAVSESYDWGDMDEKLEMHDFIDFRSASESEADDEVLDITFPQGLQWEEPRSPSDRLHRSQSKSSRRVQFAANTNAHNPTLPRPRAPLSPTGPYTSFLPSTPLVVSSPGTVDSVSSFPTRPLSSSQPRRQSSLRLPRNKLIHGVRSVVGKRASFSW